MHPHIRQKKPGKCPICGMDLTPVKTHDGPAKVSAVPVSVVKLSPRAHRLAAITTTTVRRRAVQKTLSVYGKVAYDERRVRRITAWTAGRIEKLYVTFTGDRVTRGRPLVRLYSPELITAQAELLAALNAEQKLIDSTLPAMTKTSRGLVRAARKKLRLLGLAESQIQNIARSRRPRQNVTISAPSSGVVIQKHITEGQYVRPGTVLFTVADLSRVWVLLEVYTQDLGHIEKGFRVHFTTPAHPGKKFAGRVSFVDPFVRDKTRTVRVRLSVKNPRGRLKPEMFVRATLHVPVRGGKKGKKPLLIPKTAPLITGKRALVFVTTAAHPYRFEARSVKLGPRTAHGYVVLSGLEQGEQVVTHGSFKLDASLQIQGKPSLMNPAGPEVDRKNRKQPHHRHQH